ncbi:Tripartite-type tricarboxylate transporter, receptor component TctC [Anaerovirgula multivorans]|uniref:Tripartite-type tricarboxylate transporter, receptor component TctC n=1 Tax=Anaerovirgula multivorans TaxID=312168 RepID=A0A239L4Q2_9FIRM|nr:tripartite tricarboxylate transporter substrate binding protein [Anaerovirgula multivorans]SNT25305.1 Tripartite-type tricarboxylate transporter, receptor component TctC [Anaerovirgula multivorans]
MSLKRLLSLVVVLSMVALISLTGCGSKPDSVTDATPEAIKYPTKPIILYVGYSAGGSSDLLCRILAAKMESYIGQPITVVNKTGGGGWVAWSEMIRSVKPDGYTFSLINTPNYPLGKYDTANPREYSYDALDVLVNHVTDYNVIAVRNDDERFKDFKSFVEYAKNNEVIAGSSATGIMSDDGTIIDILNKDLGTKITIVQTAGAKDNETLLLNKSADILIGNVSDVFTGKNNEDFNVLSVFSPERIGLMSDVPTAKELGFGEIYGNSSRGYAIPKGVDSQIREILVDALDKTINDPEVIKQLEDMGAETEYIEGDAYIKFLEDGIRRAKGVYGIE